MAERIMLEPSSYMNGREGLLSWEISATSGKEHIKTMLLKENSNVYYNDVEEQQRGYHYERYADEDELITAHDQNLITLMIDNLSLTSTNSRELSSTVSKQRMIESEHDESPHELFQIELKHMEGIYRLRMSEWCFKICDYIEAERYIVAVAFNYLDRFLDIEKYSCDSAFDYKLASITSLSIALKVHNRKTVNPQTLANLSNGEIAVSDITAMESMILETLSYLLCPPTCHSFIYSFRGFLPSRVTVASGDYFVQKVSFLADLSIMDISFQNLKPSIVALCATLHILDVMEDDFLSTIEKEKFIEMIASSLNLNNTRKTSKEIKHTRYKFLRVCRQCDHFKLTGAFSLEEERKQIIKNNIEERDDVPEYVPYCATHFYQRRES